MISYEDFDLRVRVDRNGFTVSARRGSQSASEPFELDLSPFEGFKVEEGGPAEIKTLGSALFDALIQGTVRDLYQQARGGAGGDAGKGLRVRILLDPRDECLRPFLRLPWEILFDRSVDANGLLALDPRRPIVRAIDSNEQTLPPTPGPLRRVLLALSNPGDLERLDLESECTAVEEALGRLSICPEILRRATRSKLDESLRDGEHQIVHFMGHGSFSRSSREGVLLLEDRYRERDPLPASLFASFFVGKPMPRLVVLASCLSAEPGRDPVVGPFASVAAALVAAGLPAVIAMQAPVRDKSAIRFTERLYRRLAKGDPVEAAVAEARIVLRAEKPKALDWAVPVLFVREQAGRIAEPTCSEEVKPPTPAPAESLPLAPTTIYQVDGGIQVIGSNVGSISYDGGSRKK